MTIVAPTPTSVYRYYDRGGLLLYVGITSRGTKRQREHNADKEWWRFVARQSVEHFQTRQEALKREVSLIQAHRPPFNKQHNPHHAEMRELYLAVAAAGPVKRYPDSAISQLGQVQHSLPFIALSRSDKTIVLRTLPEHGDIASAVDFGHRRPLLMFGKKVGSLLDHSLMGDSLVLTYTLRQGAPDFTRALGHLKSTQSPRRVWLNELQVVPADQDARVSRRRVIGGAA